MKVLIFVMTLCVVAMVTSANRAERKLRKEKCRPTIQWSKCVDGKMNKTFVASETRDATCTKPLPEAKELECLTVKTFKKGKKGCASEIRRDFTPCGDGQAEYTITRRFTTTDPDTVCPPEKNTQALCAGGKIGKMAGKAEKKALKKKFKADLKAFKISKKQELAKGCMYEKTAECVDGNMKLSLVKDPQSGSEKCLPELLRPCFAMKNAGRRKQKKLDRKMKRKNLGKNKN